MRPKSLREVGEMALARSSADFALREFLDEFQRSPLATALEGEPPPLTGQVADGERWDAYLAATAEALALRHGWPVPAWAAAPGRRLPAPWFALPGHALRNILLVESPAPFRARNLFVSANALSRA
jgi:hypothetical protein